MSAGQILLPNVVARPRVGGPPLPTVDARDACALALAEYLRCLEFVRWGGEAPTTRFKLQTVAEEWPEADVKLAFPSASIVDADEFRFEAHNFVPTPLEETWNQYGENTVLWKLAEGVADLQVDFWADDAETRTAIAARLPGAFAPGEDGTRVMLCGTCRYFDRPVRAHLLSYKRVDHQEAMFPRERRLLATVRCEIDVVDLRCAAEFKPQAVLEAVGEQVVVGIEPALDPARCK